MKSEDKEMQAFVTLQHVLFLHRIIDPITAIQVILQILSTIHTSFVTIKQESEKLVFDVNAYEGRRHLLHQPVVRIPRNLHLFIHVVLLMM